MVTALSGGPDASVFHSYRLVLGEVGRSVAAYAGAGVYLDIALGWVAGRVTTAPVALRDEGADRTSGYSLRTLVSHFWRMVLTGGTRGLRLVSVLGLMFALLGLLLAIFIAYRQLVHPAPTEGWTVLAGEPPRPIGSVARGFPDGGAGRSGWRARTRQGEPVAIGGLCWWRRRADAVGALAWVTPASGVRCLMLAAYVRALGDVELNDLLVELPVDRFDALLEVALPTEGAAA